MFRIRLKAGILNHTKTILVGMVLACVLFAIPLLMVKRPGIEPYAVHGLNVTQKDFTLTAEWKEEPKCSEYTVIVSKGISRQVEKTAEPKIEIKNVLPGEEYKVTVLAKKHGYAVKAVTTKKKVTKEKQTINVAKETSEGFEGDSLSVKSNAKGNVRYRSSDSEVAKVDEEGNVTLSKPGKAVITIAAEGTDMYVGATEKREVEVYPEKLDAPGKLKVKELTSTEVTLKWKESEFADTYQIYKLNAATGEYDTYLTEEINETSVTIPRDAGYYKVKALVKVNGEYVESELSGETEVPTIANEMESYEEITEIGAFDISNVEKAVTIAPKAYTLQAMCITKDRYIIVYSSRSGTAGMIECYTFDGELKEAAETGSIGHANGCTYDPNTNEIYVMETWSQKKIPRIAVFDAKTLKRKDDIITDHCPTGIGYDEYTNSFCLTDKLSMYVTNGDMNITSTLPRLRYKVSQDVGAYNGMALSCVWHSGMNGAIDLYRLSDGRYLGSFSVKLGEIESVAVKDGKLAILVNNGNNDAVYLSKEKIAFK